MATPARNIEVFDQAVFMAAQRFMDGGFHEHEGVLLRLRQSLVEAGLLARVPPPGEQREEAGKQIQASLQRLERQGRLHWVQQWRFAPPLSGTINEEC